MEYGLIGEKLSHSYSEYIHSMIGEYDYRLCEISPCDIDAFMKAKDFKGINVTVPYKKTVIPYLDEIDGASKEIGAVNCIRNDNGYLTGHNSDFDGMMELFIENGISVKNKKALILGSGGTSMTADAVLKNLGAEEIIKVSRSKKAGCVSYEEAKKLHGDARILVNTTPVGMYPNNFEIPVNSEYFPQLEAVVDVIYNPFNTLLVTNARRRGIKATGGLYMLVSQAVHAYSFFTDKKAEDSLTKEIYNRILTEKKNIVLIGMPSCGKTATGEILSRKTGRELIDTDREIIKKEGMEISEIFAECGEEYFRKAETEITAEISKKTGAIISTGGGIILNEKNIDMLGMNGTIFFIDRSVDKLLPTSDRPCSDSEEKIKKLFEERYSSYKKYADFTVKNDGDITDAADMIMELMKQSVKQSTENNHK